MIGIFRLIREGWWAHQRSVDMAILWPQCCYIASHKTDFINGHWVDLAKAAFAAHAFNDPAWIKHYGHQELYRVIDNLQPP